MHVISSSAAGSVIEAIREQYPRIWMFPCGGQSGKTPKWKWSKVYCPTHKLVEHVRAGGNLGIIPATAGAAVLDLDATRQQAAHVAMKLQLELGAGTPLRSRTGYHLYFRTDSSCGPKQFQAHGIKGDIRSARGYVVVWDNPVKLQEALDAPSVRLERIVGAVGQELTEADRRAGKAQNSDVEVRARGYVKGNRNRYLFMRVREQFEGAAADVPGMEAWAGQENDRLAAAAGCEALPSKGVESVCKSVRKLLREGRCFVGGRGGTSARAHRGRQAGQASGRTRAMLAEPRNKLLEHNMIHFGMSTQELAEETGLSVSQVFRLTVDARRKHKARLAEQCRSLKADGVRVAVIARGLGIPKRTVERYLSAKNRAN